jgi:hypothetical protein
MDLKKLMELQAAESDILPEVLDTFNPDLGPHTTVLPLDAQARKGVPLARGFLDYFPRAIAEVAKVSAAGSRQHHPEQEMHWDKTKSTDHADCILRHLTERGTLDTDGQRHSAKVAWRALALLEIELEAA